MIFIIFQPGTVPGCVMVARQTLDLLVGVQILPGEIKLSPYILRTYENGIFKIHWGSWHRALIVHLSFYEVYAMNAYLFSIFSL